jgi:L-alanine-DL-glutamate epimerase-like enolase superfamily enzyme
LQIALAHPDVVVLEYIPWTLECFVEPVEVVDGRFVPPKLPGAGTELRADAIERFGVIP